MAGFGVATEVSANRKLIPPRKKTRPASQSFEPTPLVRKYAFQIAQAAGGLPIIDVACGSGRNAMFLAELGGRVICIDKDLSRLPDDKSLSVSLTKLRLDLFTDPWPFGTATIGGIVLVDFLHLPLFSHFENCLVPGGRFLLETVSGRGKNYRE